MPFEHLHCTIDFLSIVIGNPIICMLCFIQFNLLRTELTFDGVAGFMQYSRLVGFCENGNGHLDSIGGRGFLGWLNEYHITNDCYTESKLVFTRNDTVLFVVSLNLVCYVSR